MALTNVSTQQQTNASYSALHARVCPPPAVVPWGCDPRCDPPVAVVPRICHPPGARCMLSPVWTMCGGTLISHNSPPRPPSTPSLTCGLPARRASTPQQRRQPRSSYFRFAQPSSIESHFWHHEETVVAMTRPPARIMVSTPRCHPSGRCCLPPLGCMTLRQVRQAPTTSLCGTPFYARTRPPKCF
jgi:hypothetical protein